MTKLIIEIVHLATFSLLPLGSSPSFVEFLIQENLNDFKSNCLFNSLMVTELSTSTLKLGGYSQEFWVRVCRTVLKTLTLFQTKLHDFSDPFSDLTPETDLVSVCTMHLNVKITREINEHVPCQKYPLFQTKKAKPYPISD